jgi:hypothetical protein
LRAWGEVALWESRAVGVGSKQEDPLTAVGGADVGGA